MTRKPLSKRTRFEVFKRDGFKCCYCGQRPPEVVLVVDHVVPVAKGGADEPENLTTSCFDCNAGKSAVSLADTAPAVDEDAIMEAMQEMAERRLILDRFYAQQRAYEGDIDAAVDAVLVAWMALLARSTDQTWSDEQSSCFERRSIVNFIRRGLVQSDFDQAIGLVNGGWMRSARNRTSLWKHFCRICWDAIRESGVDW